MKTTTSLIAAAFAAALVGCTDTPLDYHSYTEIPKGPGMFTGEDGAFVMEAKGRSPEAQAAPAPVKSAPPVMTDDEYREFQDWREWKRQREQSGKK